MAPRQHRTSGACWIPPADCDRRACEGSGRRGRHLHILTPPAGEYSVQRLGKTKRSSARDLQCGRKPKDNTAAVT